MFMACLIPVVLNLKLHDTDTNTTASAGLEDEIKTYYQDELIYAADGKLFYNQFGLKATIPQGNGKTAEWRKPTPYAKALTALTEGVTPTGHDIDVSTVTVTVDQYGDFGKISDMLKVTTLDNIVVMETKLQGSQAGRTLDTVTREVVTAGSQKLFSPKVASDDTETAILLRASITENCYLRSEDLNIAGAVLENNNAEGVEGEEFMCIVHTDIWRELMRQDDWIAASQYQGVKEIFSGEQGMIGNMRFVATSEAKIIGPSNMLGISGYTRTTLNAGVSASADIYPVLPFTVAQAAIINAAITAGTEYTLYVDEVERTVLSVTGGAVGTCKITLTESITETSGDPVCGTGAGTDGSAIYCTMVIGYGAYGVTGIEGMGLEHIIQQLGSGGTSDPLKQRATIGWKASAAAVRLVEENMVRIEHTSKWFRLQRNSN
jgi:N4-gp56 family major capsid protein